MVNKTILSTAAAFGLLGIIAPSVAFAQSGFSIGTMSQFGVVIDTGTNPTLSLTGSTINGNVGFVASSTTSPGSPSGGGINGAVDYSGASVPSSSGYTTQTGGIHGSVAAVSSAATTMSALDSTYNVTGTALSVSGNTSVTVTSGTQQGTSGVYVFDVGSTWTTSNGTAITITGGANTWVVFNFNGTAVPTFNGAITLAGGITASHVLFDYTGTTTITGSANHAVINGLIDAPNATVTLTAANLNGGIVAATGSSVQNSTVSVPEPGTMAVLAVGLGGLAAARKKRSQIA